MNAVLIVRQHLWLHKMLQMWIQIEPQRSHQILCDIVPSTWDTMSFVFDNKQQYRKTSTKSPSDLVSFSTMINEPDAWIQFIMVTKHRHSSDIVTWRPKNVHLFLQALNKSSHIHSLVNCNECDIHTMALVTTSMHSTPHCSFMMIANEIIHQLLLTAETLSVILHE